MVEGFVFVAGGDPGVMEAAAPGVRVESPSPNPPWIVVDHDLDSVIVPRWPGRLYRVRTVIPASPTARKAAAAAQQGVRQDAGYTRALAVDVLDELRPSILFGPNGEEIEPVLADALELSAEQAHTLRQQRHPHAARSYSRVWDRWLLEQDGDVSFIGEDHAGLLLAPLHGNRMCSPIRRGLAVVHGLVWDRAAGCGGTRIDDQGGGMFDDEDEAVLISPWSDASSALIEAALALGSPNQCSPEDYAVLTQAWKVLRSG